VPTAGRPEGYHGLVGRVHVQRHAEPESLALGEALRVSVLLRGDANLWDAGPPIVEHDLEAGAALFSRPPELDLEPGRRLGVRRFFRYEIVPHQSGLLELPALRIPYFDPVEGRFAFADAKALRIGVAPRRASRQSSREPRRGTGAAHAAGAGAARDPVARSTPGRAWGAWLGGALIAVAALQGLRVLREQRRWRAVGAGLEAASSARARGDARAEAGALAAALRAGLTAARLDLDPRPDGARKALLEVAARQLAELERARFAAVGAELDVEGIEETLRRMRRRG